MNNQYTNVLNCLSQGVIIENLSTGEIIHTNDIIKELLKIPETKTELNMGDILNNKASLTTLHSNIRRKLVDEIEAFETICFKSFYGIYIEVIFRCVWIDKEKDLVIYIFQCSKEWIGEHQLSFYEVAEYLPNGVIVVEVKDEPTLALTYANVEHYKILGYDEPPTDREVKMYLKDFIWEEDKDWVLSDIQNAAKTNEKIDIEFRMKQKSGELKWARLFGQVMPTNFGTKLLYASLKDLSDIRQINDKLQLEKIVFHKITEISNELIFRLDMQTNIINFYGNKPEIFKDISVMENFPECILDKEFIFEADIPIFLNMIECFKSGEDKNIELRHRTNDGDFEWASIIYNMVKSDDGETLLVMGKFTSIHKQKLFEAQAKIDLLTELYNKITTGIEVNDILTDFPRNEHILFIIDIDNFKAINDDFGHQFGDDVLRDVALTLKNSFRKNDIIGRIGGDEFVVLMKSCSDNEAIVDNAQKVCNLLQKVYVKDSNRNAISASIGIASYPYDGRSFEELYKMADRALYVTKRNGKNGYTQYSDIIVNDNNQVMLSNNLGRRNDDDIDAVILTTIFNLLHESENFKYTLHEVLQLLAKNLKVENCFIMESLEDESYKTTYNWSISPKVNAIDDVCDKDYISHFTKHKDLYNIFYTDDINEFESKELVNSFKEKNVHSILLIQSSIGNNGILGVYECKKRRVWTTRETKTLYAISKVIFSALEYNNQIKSLKGQIKALTNKDSK